MSLTSRDDGSPPALVLGDIDLVRPLARDGIRCAVFAAPLDPVRLSRQVFERLPFSDPWGQPEAVVQAILEFAGQEDGRPVLMPQGDGELLVVSRNRERLAERCSYLLADSRLVEDLVDKARFVELARRLDLPVPRAERVQPSRAKVADVGLRYPLIVKPLLRNPELWRPVGGLAKAVAIRDEADLTRLWARMADVEELEVLMQEQIPGPESRVESYHTYVDATGRIAAEFTGRKIRTLPREYGRSTAVEISVAPDVSALGREVIERLGLVGVAKADFKRAWDGSLHLLEVNPRFTLWHNPAAIAGVNVPALVHADLTGRPRPAGRAPTPGTTWCLPLSDLRASLEQGVGLVNWLRFVAGCDAISGLSGEDPFPFFPGAFWRAGASRARNLVGRR